MHPPESSLSAPGYALPDLETFGAALIPDAPRHKALRELHALLGKLDPNAELSERVDRLEALSRWVRASGKLPPTEDAELSERSQVHRFRVLVRALERFGAIRSRVQAG
jgi:site-specific recombinase